jgi:hypothetical protein
MGIDFISKIAPGFHKSLDRGRVELGTPNLFTVNPERKPRTVCAEVADGCELLPGEQLLVRLVKGILNVERDDQIVAVIRTPPREVIEGVQESHCAVAGTIESINRIAHVADISLR